MQLNATKEMCVEHINKNLMNNAKITKHDLLTVGDHRNNKGPIVIELTDIAKKIAILKSSSEELVIKNCLSKENVALRKKAIALKEKGKISKVWDYKGSIYFTIPGQEERVLATQENLTSPMDLVVQSSSASGTTIT